MLVLNLYVDYKPVEDWLQVLNYADLMINHCPLVDSPSINHDHFSIGLNALPVVAFVSALPIIVIFVVDLFVIALFVIILFVILVVVLDFDNFTSDIFRS